MTYRMAFVFFFALLTACSSSGPKTQYYSLFATKDLASSETTINDSRLSFGVGPLTIPEYMDNPSIVSITNNQQVKVSGSHAWAGDLKAAMSRVLADNLARYWQLEKVAAFPWDNRLRPDYQVRLVFDEFGGERGGEVNLRVAWSLLNKTGDQLYLTKRSSLKLTVTSDSASDYVAALNNLLNQLSEEIAIVVQNHLKISSDPS